MGDFLGSFPKSVRVRTKHVVKTRVDLWGQSAILKAVWDVTERILVISLIYEKITSFLCRMATRYGLKNLSNMIHHMSLN